MSSLNVKESDKLKVVVRDQRSPDGEVSNNDVIYVNPGEKWRILKNILVLSFAFMALYVAFQGTLNLQSSLNSKDGLGTIALCCLYISMGISCLLLPALVIHYLTCKWTLVVCIAGFIPYIALQLLSSFYTLVPAAILLGIAVGPMWTAASTYITQTAQIYAILTQTEVDSVVTLFFGILYFILQNSDTIGNLISSLGMCKS